jgi:hypothetical protein
VGKEAKELIMFDLDKAGPHSLSDKDCQKLVVNLLAARRGGDASEEEIGQLLAWADYIQLNYAAIQMALQGLVLFDVKNINEDDDNLPDIVVHTTQDHLSPAEQQEYQLTLLKCEQDD